MSVYESHGSYGSFFLFFRCRFDTIVEYPVVLHRFLPSLGEVIVILDDLSTVYPWKGWCCLISFDSIIKLDRSRSLDAYKKESHPY